jgi:hypothetical protein
MKQYLKPTKGKLLLSAGLCILSFFLSQVSFRVLQSVELASIFFFPFRLYLVV